MNSKKTKNGVHYLMIEEYVQKILDKASDYHKRQIKQIHKDYIKELNSELNVFKSKFKRMEEELREMKARHNRKKKSKEDTEMLQVKANLEAKGFNCG